MKIEISVHFEDNIVSKMDGKPRKMVRMNDSYLSKKN